MGKTLNTGNLTNAISQDASNNIGVGGAPSGSFKLEVTGTTKVSGQLTLGSTITNGTNTYTLPAETGTLALANTSLKITYTGSPQYDILFSLVPGNAKLPVGTVSGQATYTANNEPAISFFTYNENTINANKLTTFSFDDLASVAGTFNPQQLSALTSLTANSLTTINGVFAISGMPLLTTLQFNALTTIGSFNFSSLNVLSSMTFNSLKSINGSVSFSQMPLLTTLQFNSLTTIGSNFQPSNIDLLTSISINSLQTIGGNFSVSTFPALTSISFLGMVTYGSDITISSCANITSATLGTIGTLKRIEGENIYLNNLKLPSANVNAILALLVSLDGTGGTTLWGAGKTLLINGGTNGAPTGTGITDKATLIARGATITTN